MRSARFAQKTLTDIVVTALKEKYGTPTSKKGLLIWRNDTKNAMCHMMPHMGNQNNFCDPECGGLEVMAAVDTCKEILRGLKAVLINHGEIKRQLLATNNYRPQLQEKRRQARPNKASQDSALTL